MNVVMDRKPATLTQQKALLVGGPATNEREEGQRRAIRWGPLAVTFALFAAANLQVIHHVSVRFAGPALAFWLFFALPAYLLYTTSMWNRTSAVERFAYSVAGTLMLLVVGGLAINTLLPWFGVPRPLAPVPILLLVDVLNISLFVLRSYRPEIPSWRSGLAGLQRQEIRLMVVAGLCLPLVVFGANRLNNGSGDQVSLVALVAMSAALILLLTWADRIASGITGVTIYLVSASVLLMTSLRGWSVTGHDIQLEYRVFQLTAAHGQWNFHSLNNAFNACLSITIFPTEMASLMHIDHPYIYKVFFQLIFAACPVMVYAISRRYFSERISILGAIYFIGFPTFLTDMPYLNRQEMALILVGAGILAITNPNWSKRRKQVALIVAAVGVELTHYSTSYIFVGTLGVAWLAEHVGRVGSWWTRRPAHSETSRTRRWATPGRTIGLGCLVAVAAFVTIWGGLATHTAGGAADEIKGAVSGFFDGSGNKSSAVSYGLFSGKSQSPQSILDQYRKQTLKAREKSPEGTYLPEKVVAQYRTPVVNEPNLPLTGIGRALGEVGVSASSLNTVIRLLAAYGEQVFVVIGLVVLIFSRTLNRRVSTRVLLFVHQCLDHVGSDHGPSRPVGRVRSPAGVPVRAHSSCSRHGHRFADLVQIRRGGLESEDCDLDLYFLLYLNHRSPSAADGWLWCPAHSEQQRDILRRVLHAPPGGCCRHMAPRKTRHTSCRDPGR